MSRKKDKEYAERAAIGRCGTCAKPFDRREAAKAAREGYAFIHECGRVLVKAR